MRRKLEELKTTLEGFVDQREHLLLVVSVADPEVVYVAKTLEGLDEAAASDLFLIFSEPFTEAPAYASAVLKNLELQLEVAQKARQARKEAPLPPFPPLCGDASAPPEQRLRAAIDHVSSLVPAEGWHRIVWVFLPMQIADQAGYARLVGQFILWRGPELWMRGLRVIARDDRLGPFLFPALRKCEAPGVSLYALDMSPEALNDALVREAGDRSAPVADRMQALMQLAGLDYAHRRYPEALDKYQLLYRYHATQKAPVMQAATLQGVGDVLRRMGDLRGAKRTYQQALTLAGEAKTPPLLLNLTFAIGDVSLELHDDRDAEGFFGLAEQLAGRLMNPFVRAEALEKQGIARHRAGNATGAMVSWIGAAALCKAFAYHERHCAVLDRLIGAYRSMHLRDQRRACEADLEAARSALKASARTTQEHPLRTAIS